MALYIALFLLLSILWAVSLWKFQPSLKWLIGFALLFRAILLPAGLLTPNNPRLILYDDVWRYLWEGHVWSAGLNPMRTAPAKLEEYDLQKRNPGLHAKLYPTRQWGEIYDNIGYREVASPYPWTAHAIFRLAHWLRPGSLLALKVIVLAFDLGAMALLWRFGNFALRLRVESAGHQGIRRIGPRGRGARLFSAGRGSACRPVGKRMAGHRRAGETGGAPARARAL
jgi:hypothetical protein